MSTQGHPLDDALADAERAGAGYEVPVELVRAGVRRRRRVRAVARGAAAVATVAVVAVVLPTALGGWGGGAPAAQGDWPAQFDRCGEAVEVPTEVDDGPVTVTLELQDTVGADRFSVTSTWVQFDPASVAEATPAAFEAWLLRDGVVVGVEDDADRLVVPLEDLATAPPGPGLTVWSSWAGLVSCAQHPDGAGDARVPPGGYELLVTQTIGWRAQDGSDGSTRVSARAPVTVTEEERPDAAPLPGECGADASALESLAGPEANPFPVTLDADVPAEAPAGTELRFPVSATNEGRSSVSAYVGRPSVVLTQAGKVVATPTELSDLTLSADVTPNTSLGYEGTSALVDCTSVGRPDAVGPDAWRPLAPGSYEVWVGLALFLTGPSAPRGSEADVHLLAGPWPLTLR